MTTNTTNTTNTTDTQNDNQKQSFFDYFTWNDAWSALKFTGATTALGYSAYLTPDFARNAGTAIWNTGAGIGAGIQQAAPNVGTAIWNTGEAIGTGIGGAATNVGTAIWNTGGAIGTGIGGAATNVGTAIWNTGAGIGAGIQQAAPNVGTAIWNTGAGIGAGIQQAAPNVGTAIWNTGEAIGTGIGGAATNVGTAIWNAGAFFGYGAISIVAVDGMLGCIAIGSDLYAKRDFVDESGNWKLNTNSYVWAKANYEAYSFIRAEVMQAYNGISSKINDNTGETNKNNSANPMKGLSQSITLHKTLKQHKELKLGAITEEYFRQIDIKHSTQTEQIKGLIKEHEAEVLKDFCQSTQKALNLFARVNLFKSNAEQDLAAERNYASKDDICEQFKQIIDSKITKNDRKEFCQQDDYKELDICHSVFEEAFAAE